MFLGRPIVAGGRGIENRRAGWTSMVDVLIVLVLRFLLSVAAIVVIGAGLAIASGAVRERGPFDKRSLGATLVCWMMIETLVAFYSYDLVPITPWVLLCCLEFFLHTGVLCRLLGRSMKSALPLAGIHAAVIATVLLTIIHLLEGSYQTGSM